MKGEKNIEDFIQKKMQEGQLQEEDWNVPSDDIWESAKPHFPQKKKRRGFLFLLVPGLLVASFVVAYFTYFNNSNTVVNTEQVSIDKIEPQVNEKTEVVAVRKIASDELVSEVVGSTEKVPSKITDQKYKANEQDLFQQLESNENVINQRQEISTISVKPKSKSNMEEITSVKSVAETFENTLANSTNFFNNQSKTKNVENKVSESKVIAPKIAELSEDRMDINLVDQLQDKKDEPILDAPLPEFNPAFNPKLEMGKPMNKWELGLAHSRVLLLSKFLWTDTDSLNANEKITVDIKSFSANLSITRRVSKRWSFTSGINFVEAVILPTFEVEEIHEEEIGDASFRRVLTDKIPVGSIVINDLSTELNVQLKPGVTLSEGEKLFITGSLPLKIGMVQVPFIANFHMGKRKSKFETILHSGFSIDYMWASIDEEDISVFRNDILITEPLVFDPISIAEFGLSAYVGAGFRYHLNDHWNIGVSTMLDVTSLILSRANFGIYHGF